VALCCAVLCQFDLASAAFGGGRRCPSLTVWRVDTEFDRPACQLMLRYPRLRMLCDVREDGDPPRPLTQALARRAHRLHRTHRANWMAAAVALSAMRVDPLIGLSVSPMLTGICAMADGSLDDRFAWSGVESFGLGKDEPSAPIPPVRPTLRVSQFVACRFVRSHLRRAHRRAAEVDDAEDAEMWAECDARSVCPAGVSVEWESVHRPSAPIVLANRFDVLNSSD
jgi:hypothetical protein